MNKQLQERETETETGTERDNERERESKKCEHIENMMGITERQLGK